jgi:uncharacterized membrane protein (UPF0127 family)
MFGKEQEHSFWMEKTSLYLDMILLNAAKEVVGVVADTPPFSGAQQTFNELRLYTIELRPVSAKRYGV